MLSAADQQLIEKAKRAGWRPATQKAISDAELIAKAQKAGWKKAEQEPGVMQGLTRGLFGFASGLPVGAADVGQSVSNVLGAQPIIDRLARVSDVINRAAPQDLERTLQRAQQASPDAFGLGRFAGNIGGAIGLSAPVGAATEAVLGAKALTPVVSRAASILPDAATSAGRIARGALSGLPTSALIGAGAAGPDETMADKLEGAGFGSLANIVGGSAVSGLREGLMPVAPEIADKVLQAAQNVGIRVPKSVLAQGRGAVNWLRALPGGGFGKEEGSVSDAALGKAGEYLQALGGDLHGAPIADADQALQDSIVNAANKLRAEKNSMWDGLHGLAESLNFPGVVPKKSSEAIQELFSEDLPIKGKALEQLKDKLQPFLPATSFAGEIPKQSMPTFKQAKEAKTALGVFEDLPRDQTTYPAISKARNLRNAILDDLKDSTEAFGAPELNAAYSAARKHYMNTYMPFFNMPVVKAALNPAKLPDNIAAKAFGATQAAKSSSGDLLAKYISPEDLPKFSYGLLASKVPDLRAGVTADNADALSKAIARMPQSLQNLGTLPLLDDALTVHHFAKGAAANTPLRQITSNPLTATVAGLGLGGTAVHSHEEGDDGLLKSLIGLAPIAAFGGGAISRALPFEAIERGLSAASPYAGPGLASMLFTGN